jgi:hypothetical protein
MKYSLIGGLIAALCFSGLAMSAWTYQMVEDLSTMHASRARPQVIIRKIDASVLDVGEEAALLDELAQVTSAGEDALRRHAACEVERSALD